MAVYEWNGKTPRVHESAWIADSAAVIGDVEIGPGASVWFGTVLRGDVERIAIGEGSNIQELSVLHADPGKPLVVGPNVTVGHKAMLHGCVVGEESLIGIGAIVLNGARIGRNCLVGAGALITEGKTFADGSMIVGAPARTVRPLTPEEIERLRASPRRYAERAQQFRATLKKLA